MAQATAKARAPFGVRCIMLAPRASRGERQVRPTPQARYAGLWFIAFAVFRKKILELMAGAVCSGPSFFRIFFLHFASPDLMPRLVGKVQPAGDCFFELFRLFF